MKTTFVPLSCPVIGTIQITEAASVRLSHLAVACLWKALGQHFQTIVSQDAAPPKLQLLPENPELGLGVITGHKALCGVAFEVFTSFDHRVTVVHLRKEAIKNQPPEYSDGFLLDASSCFSLAGLGQSAYCQPEFLFS